MALLLSNHARQGEFVEAQHLGGIRIAIRTCSLSQHHIYSRFPVPLLERAFANRPSPASLRMQWKSEW